MSNSRIMKKMVIHGLLLMMGVSISACGAGTEKWKEEVQLTDGKVIVIERETIRERGGDEWAFNRSGTKPKEYRIRLAYPVGAGQMIEWHSTKIDPQTWPEVPLILDMELGKPVILAIVAISSGCMAFSKYVYTNGIWIEETLPEHLDQRDANLLIFDDKDMQQFINLAIKREKNSDSHTQGYRKVGPNRKVCG